MRDKVEGIQKVRSVGLTDQLREFLAGVSSLDDDDIGEKTGRRLDLERH